MICPYIKAHIIQALIENGKEDDLDKYLQKFNLTMRCLGSQCGRLASCSAKTEVKK